MQVRVRKEPEGKNAKGGRKKCSRKIFQKISQKIEDITFTGFYSISGYLRNLRGRLLSSEKFSEVFTLWVFTLKPFPEGAATEGPLALRSQVGPPDSVRDLKEETHRPTRDPPRRPRPSGRRDLLDTQLETDSVAHDKPRLAIL